VSGPLGVKDTCKWLNEHGYRTRLGAAFGVGPVHGILKNACYATGKWPYGVRNSRTGAPHDPANVVEVDVPAIIPMELFERVQARLVANNPKVTPPRIANGPTLLTGLAVCASCGAGMTRTGTNRGERSYAYYSCAGCQQKGKSVCKGRHIRMEKLDDAVIENVQERLLAPERLAEILELIVERRASQDRAVADRRRTLEAELSQAKDKLARLYRAIEEGVVDLDADLKERTQTLKNARDLSQATLDRLAAQARSGAEVTPERVDAFAKLMREKLERGDAQARKTYLRSVISCIEVDDQKIRIIGEKAALADVIAGRQTQAANVRGFIRKWRAREDSSL
jgi:site-specific DNA recombinase